MAINPGSPVGLYLYERGGLTCNNDEPDVLPVDHFAYCQHCDIGVPVDAQQVCMYCVNPVPLEGQAQASS